MQRFTLLAPALLFAAAPAATAQDFAPAVFASIHDAPPDGVGDIFNVFPFEGLLRETASQEDRAIQEFDVSSLSGMSISSATLTGQVHVNNAFDNGPRTFDFLIYDGNGTAELTDFQIPATFVGSDSYHPPMDTSFDYSFDVTAAVGNLIAGGATHIGLRVDPTSSPNFPNVLSETLSVLSITTGTGGGVGTSYCSGDGSGSACPCGNEGSAGHGCANSASDDGARLSGAGSTSVGAGNLLLQGSDLRPNQPGLYFQGDNATNGGDGAVFGDGLRCAGMNVVRLQTVTASGAGTSATSVDVAMKGGASAGDTKRYQLWYRDPNVGPCGTGFNLSQGLEIAWMP